MDLPLEWVRNGHVWILGLRVVTNSHSSGGKTSSLFLGEKGQRLGLPEPREIQVGYTENTEMQRRDPQTEPFQSPAWPLSEPRWRRRGREIWEPRWKGSWKLSKLSRGVSCRVPQGKGLAFQLPGRIQDNNPRKNRTQSKVTKIYYPKLPVFDQKSLDTQRNPNVRPIPRKKV